MELYDAFKKLPPIQRKAIPLVANGFSGARIAEMLNRNPATVSQWINHNKQFKEALYAYSKESLNLASVQLESLSIKAMEELRELLINAKSEQVRLKAVELIISTIGMGTHGEKLLITTFGNVNKAPESNAELYDLDKLIEAVRGD